MDVKNILAHCDHTLLKQECHLGPDQGRSATTG